MNHDLACVVASIVFHKNQRQKLSDLIDSPGELSQRTVLELHSEFSRLTNIIADLRTEKRKIKGA